MVTDTIRLELKIRNNVLWHAIFDMYESVAEFCRAMNVGDTACQGVLGSWLNLKKSPYGPRGPYKLALTTAEFTGFSVEELFAPDLYASLPSRTTYVVEMNHKRFLPLAAASKLALPPAQAHSADDVDAIVSNVLHSLTPREERVIRSKFGIGSGEDPATNAELAAKWGISPARVHQIEAKALSKLRHPSRAKQLRALLNNHNHELRHYGIQQQNTGGVGGRGGY